MTTVQSSLVVLALVAKTTTISSAAGEKSPPIIATHDARFHCDEVTACFMLQQLDRFRSHQIMRTRDPAKLAQADVVIDVGGRLDLNSLRFDHHQRSFNQTIHHYHPRLRTTNPTSPPRLSSAGLVYAVFGKDVITKVLLKGHSTSYKELNAEDQRNIDAIYESVYVAFIEEMDAIDNGIEAVSGEGIVYNYHIQTGIVYRVNKHNPGPNVPSEVALRRFKRAMDLVGKELIETIEFYRNVIPKGQGMREAIVRRKEFDPSGQIVLVDGEKMVQWKTALASLEWELGIEGEIKYLVYQEKRSPYWRVVAAATEPNSFKSRLPLKEEWRGLQDERLQEVSGVRGATFVHANGFTGGAKSLEGVRQLCVKSLEAAARGAA